MKILIFNWRDIKNPTAGGAEVITHENAKRWLKAGHKVTLFTSAFSRGKKKEKIDGIEIIRAGNRYTVYWHAFRYYRKYFRGNFDLVIDEINSIPFFTPLYIREPKVALIFQLTSKIYFQELPKFLAFPLYLLEPMLFRIYRRGLTVVLSSSIKKELVEHGFSSHKIDVVSPGVDHENLSPGEKTNFPTILYFNRLARYKNVDDLIKAFKLLKEEISTSRLLIVGCRNGKYERELRKLATKLNLNEDIRFYPFLTGEKKKKMLQSSWIHVLPSTKEGWGISVIEAAACGTPTIGYDVCGLRDSVKNGETGLLVPYGKIEDLAEAIKKVLSNTNFRRDLSQNSIKYAKEFNWKKSAQMTEKIMKELIT